jgi:DNA-binding NarL/FixJ family response regulator
MSEVRPRVLIADDHPLMLDGLRKLLEIDCEVVAAVKNGRELLEAAERLRPDLIVTDIDAVRRRPRSHAPPSENPTRRAGARPEHP